MRIIYAPNVIQCLMGLAIPTCMGVCVYIYVRVTLPALSISEIAVG